MRRGARGDAPLPAALSTQSLGREKLVTPDQTGSQVRFENEP